MILIPYKDKLKKDNKEKNNYQRYEENSIKIDEYFFKLSLSLLISFLNISFIYCYCINQIFLN
jgi:hypothetical protein